MSAAVDIRGLKRVCVECGVRFYDMNKRPIVCPNCNAEFTNQPKVKARKAIKDDVDVKAKAALSKKAVIDESEDEIIANDDDLNLDDVVAMEDGDDDEDEDTLALDDDDLEDLDALGIDDLEDDDLDELDVIEEDED